jgi:hypothetical protein
VSGTTLAFIGFKLRNDMKRAWGKEKLWRWSSIINTSTQNFILDCKLSPCCEYCILLVCTAYEDETECSETSAHTIQTQGESPKRKNTTIHTLLDMLTVSVYSSYQHSVCPGECTGHSAVKTVRLQWL